MSQIKHHGACLCGGVRYEIAGPLESPVACHCSQCARTSGNYATMAAFDAAGLQFTTRDTLAWYKSSAHVRRGFCNRCGGNLFWMAETDAESADKQGLDAKGADARGLNAGSYVSTGTLDRPTGLRLGGHIFIGSQSDVYEIVDDLPKKLKW